MSAPRRNVAAVAAMAALLMCCFQSNAFAGNGDEEKLAYALVQALARSEQAILNSLQAVAPCSVKGHRQCLPATSRALANVAAAQQKPVRAAVDLQDRRCSRSAGRQYLTALRVLRRGALALARSKTKRDRNAAARLLTRADRLETAGVKHATACWRKTLQ